VVVEPKGQIKMSEVIENFVNPCLDVVHTPKAHKQLFAIASFSQTKFCFQI
jgi:hypothetical protein